jgi:PHD/YefM family antitoxin component YafN of YafNO toxin-antitoxin module
LKDVEEDLKQVLDDVLLCGQSFIIMKDAGNAVLVSEGVYRGMTETLNLLSILGVRESIRSGMRGHIADTAAGLEW